MSKLRRQLSAGITNNIETRNLDEIKGNDHYILYRDKIWNWLLNGPIKTKE